MRLEVIKLNRVRRLSDGFWANYFPEIRVLEANNIADQLNGEQLANFGRSNLSLAVFQLRGCNKLKNLGRFFNILRDELSNNATPLEIQISKKHLWSANKQTPNYNIRNYRVKVRC